MFDWAEIVGVSDGMGGNLGLMYLMQEQGYNVQPIIVVTEWLIWSVMKSCSSLKDLVTSLELFVIKLCTPQLNILIRLLQITIQSIRLIQSQNQIQIQCHMKIFRLGELAVQMGRGNETAGLIGTRRLIDYILIL